MNPPSTVHSVTSFTNLPLMNDSTLLSMQIVSAVFHSPTGFSTEAPRIGTGVFLFASVLERFLALYANINSFSQLIAKTKQGETRYKKWPPRAGEVPLL